MEYGDCNDCDGKGKYEGSGSTRDVQCATCRGHGVSLRALANLLCEIRDQLVELNRNLPRTPSGDGSYRR